jgi:hypothetical protein
MLLTIMDASKFPKNPRDQAKNPRDQAKNLGDQARDPREEERRGKRKYRNPRNVGLPLTFAQQHEMIGLNDTIKHPNSYTQGDPLTFAQQHEMIGLNNTIKHSNPEPPAKPQITKQGETGSEAARPFLWGKGKGKGKGKEKAQPSDDLQPDYDVLHQEYENALAAYSTVYNQLYIEADQNVMRINLLDPRLVEAAQVRDEACKRRDEAWQKQQKQTAPSTSSSTSRFTMSNSPYTHRTTGQGPTLTHWRSRMVNDQVEMQYWDPKYRCWKVEK